MPFNPNQGIGREEAKWKRALWALPLLGVLYITTQTMGIAVQLPSIIGVVSNLNTTGGIILENGQHIPVISKFIGVKAVDKFVRIYVAIFTPMLDSFDNAAHAQGLLFLADLIPLQAIWAVESIRRGNFLTAAHVLYVILSCSHRVCTDIVGQQ